MTINYPFFPAAKPEGKRLVASAILTGVLLWEDIL
jgi:hypothetical protein